MKKSRDLNPEGCTRTYPKLLFLPFGKGWERGEVARGKTAVGARTCVDRCRLFDDEISRDFLVFRRDEL